MKILVTGGAGFLGSHLCDRLLKIGHHVICVDNFLTGQRENIETHKNLLLIEHDICDPLKIDDDLDEIYNCACPASPTHYQKDPLLTMCTCTTGVYNMLELARGKDAKIMQASTSEVYGDPLVHPQTESYFGNVNPTGIRACYDEGKRCAEALFFDFNRMHDTKIKIARIFNTYGAKMQEDDGRVVSNFIIQALKEEPLTIYGDGTQTRSFCYVDDMIDGFIRLMRTDSAFIGPVNLGNSTEFMIKDIAKTILELTGSSSKIEFHPLPSDDPKQRCPDITLAQKVLDWQPKVTLEYGLKKTIDYFSSKLEGPCCINELF